MAFVDRISGKVKHRHTLFAQILYTTLAFILMVYLSYLYTSSIVNKSLTRYAQSTFSFAQERIGTSIKDSKIIVGSYARTISGMIQRGYSMRDLHSYVQEMSSFIRGNELQTIGANMVYLVVEDELGKPILLCDTHDDIPCVHSPLERPWYELAVNSDGSVIETHPYMCKITKQLVVTFAQAIYDSEGNRLGIVGIDVRVAEIGKDIIEIALDRDGYGILFDNNLNIIAHNNKDFIGVNLRDPMIPLSVHADAIEAGIDVFDEPFANWQGTKVVAIVRELPNGWYLALLTPSNPYYQSITRMMYILCVFGLALAAFLIMILINLDNKRSRADKESKQKSVFLANMSHEIRTPMNAIIGMTTIGKTANDLKRKDHCFAKIEEASNHLLGVINDILDISRIEANKVELSVAEFDLRQMVKRVTSIMNCRFEENNQSFITDIDDSIPDTLMGDDLRLAQVLTNLLGNATKFTPKRGEIKLTVRQIESDDEQCTIEVAVSDTGIGISAQQQQHLFQSFKQAESGTARKYGGTGLGLAISKGIIELMGGEVWIESEIGRGATFAFKVCLEKIPEDAVKAADEEETGKNIGILSGKRVLLAEDTEINYEILTALLEPTHMNIDWAENGEEAVRKFTESHGEYDIVLMDIQMPMMDGYEATRRIRASDVPGAKAIPIIAMTANVFREDIERCLESGMNDHLGKPVDYNAVITKLHDYLQTG